MMNVSEILEIAEKHSSVIESFDGLDVRRYKVVEFDVILAFARAIEAGVRKEIRELGGREAMIQRDYERKLYSEMIFRPDPETLARYDLAVTEDRCVVRELKEEEAE